MLKEIWEAFKDALENDSEFRLTVLIIFTFIALLFYGIYSCVFCYQIANISYYFTQSTISTLPSVAW